MSDLKLPGEDKKKGEISFARIAVWVIVSAIAVYLIATGLVGILTKG